MRDVRSILLVLLAAGCGSPEVPLGGPDDPGGGHGGERALPCEPPANPGAGGSGGEVIGGGGEGGEPAGPVTCRSATRDLEQCLAAAEEGCAEADLLARTTYSEMYDLCVGSRSGCNEVPGCYSGTPACEAARVATTAANRAYAHCRRSCDGLVAARDEACGEAACTRAKQELFDCEQDARMTCAGDLTSYAACIEELESVCRDAILHGWCDPACEDPAVLHCSEPLEACATLRDDLLGCYHDACTGARHEVAATCPGAPMTWK